MKQLILEGTKTGTPNLSKRCICHVSIEKRLEHGIALMLLPSRTTCPCVGALEANKYACHVISRNVVSSFANLVTGCNRKARAPRLTFGLARRPTVPECKPSPCGCHSGLALRSWKEHPECSLPAFPSSEVHA